MSGGAAARAAHVEEEDVGLAGFDRNPVDLRQSIGQQRGVGVVFGKPIPMAVERMEAGGGKDARLPHGPAHALLPAPCLVDEGGRAGKHSAHGAAEPLAQVDPGAVEAGAVIGRGGAGGHNRIRQPRPVQMGCKAVRAGDIRYRLHGFQRPDRAAAHIGGVLDLQQRGAGRIAVFRADCGFGLFRRVDAALARYGRDLHAGKRGRPAALEVQDVAGGLGNHLVARPAMDPDRNLVAHRSGGQEHGSFVAEQCRHPFAERVDARVGERLLVADRRLRHRPAHFGRRQGLGVAVEVDARRIRAFPGR